MKKLFFTTFLSLSLMGAYAKGVDTQTAELVAKNFHFQQQNLYENPIRFDEIHVSHILTESRNGSDLLYICEVKDGGYIIVSADDRMSPVLAYIPEVQEWDYDKTNPGLQYMLRKYSNMIEELISDKAEQNAEIAKDWATYTTNDPTTLLNVKNEEIGPLLNTVWNQDYPYNYYAPAANGGSGGRCYAGCVATAMSVLMEYWRWPDHGEGETTFYSPVGGFLSADFENTYYNWDAMLTSINTNSEEEAILANALLQYHCGIAVQMQYSPNGSGAYSGIVPFVMNTYFRYSDDIDIVSKQDDGIPQSEWNEMIYNELSQLHVLYYAGCDNSGCHAFNCDGYRDNNGTTYHHFNFNWSGSGNGWYVATNPGGYSSSEDIILNAVPDTVDNVYPQFPTGTKVLTSKVGRVTDGSGPIEDYIPTEAAWLIDPANAEGDSIVNVTLSWESFQLADGDYVRVYDGDNTDAELLGEYTGTSTPGSVTSTGDKILVAFSATGNAPGFTFTYSSTRPSYCSGLEESSEDPFYISSSPEGKFYQPKSLCRYRVSYDGKPVKISFNYLDTYDEEDYIEIYDAASNTLYGPFFGNEKPEDIIIEGEAHITFKSDNFNSSNYGFGLTCTSFDAIEDKENSELIIYPNPASKQINISYNNLSNSTVEYRILNINGTVMLSDNLKNTGENINEAIDISNLRPGVYLIQIIDNKNIISKKLIVE